jgi:hypothetical protein
MRLLSGMVVVRLPTVLVIVQIRIGIAVVSLRGRRRKPCKVLVPFGV